MLRCRVHDFKQFIVAGGKWAARGARLYAAGHDVGHHMRKVLGLPQNARHPRRLLQAVRHRCVELHACTWLLDYIHRGSLNGVSSVMHVCGHFILVQATHQFNSCINRPRLRVGKGGVPEQCSHRWQRHTPYQHPSAPLLPPHHPRCCPTAALHYRRGLVARLWGGPCCRAPHCRVSPVVPASHACQALMGTSLLRRRTVDILQYACRVLYREIVTTEGGVHL